MNEAWTLSLLKRPSILLRWLSLFPRGSSFGGWCLLLGLAAGAVGCRTAATRRVDDPVPVAAAPRAGTGLEAEADALVKPLLADGTAYGLVVGVVTPDGATHTFGYGKTGRPDDIGPPDGNTIFQIGSLSKLFTETLFLQLAAEHQLRFEDTVRDTLPEAISVSSAAGTMTLYELATHTSGLPREPFAFAQMRALVRYLLTGRNIYAPLTTHYALNYLRHSHPHFRERGKFYYSNLGFGLLGYMIHARTGRPTTDLIAEKVCRPLKMTDSVFVLDDDQQSRLAVGHVGNQACWKFANTELAPWDMGEFMGPVGGMFSTVNDLLIFAKANLGLIPSALNPALQATQQVQVQSARGGEAFGWIISKYGNRTITFKDGMVSGYCSFIGMDLERQVAVVVLANKFNWDDDVGLRLLLRISGAKSR
jgi:CubicO group peptidase (beta-lactamase class C family)